MRFRERKKGSQVKESKESNTRHIGVISLWYDQLNRVISRKLGIFPTEEYEGLAVRSNGYLKSYR